MANPFPGMNPWLEHPSLWSDVYFRLISSIARHQSLLLGPRYYVSIESFTPDVVEETYLKVREAETGQVVTVIEILSPTNLANFELRIANVALAANNSYIRPFVHSFIHNKGRI